MNAAVLGSLVQVSAVDGLLVSLSDARLHLRWDSDDTSQDAALTDMIHDATDYLSKEIMGGRQFLPATYDVPVCDWWSGPLSLPMPPLQSVDSITYYDTTDTAQTYSSTNYQVKIPFKAPGTVEVYPLTVPPVLSPYRSEPITIRFTAGYYCTVTADATANTLTTGGRTFSNGQRVTVWNYGGAVPAGLTAGTSYYVVNASSTSFKLATTVGGSAIDLTDAGTGTNYVGDVPRNIRRAVMMLVGHFDANREAVIGGARMVSTEIAMSVAKICEQSDWGSYA